MSRPSWSPDNTTFYSLPGAYRFGGRPRSKERGSIDIETDLGKRYVYKLWERKVLDLIFRVSEDQLDFYTDFDMQVDGSTIPFYFSISGDGAADSIYVRKEAGFDPVELDTPGGDQAYFDYNLKLTEEIV